jgi:hypothetical protein
MSVQCSKLPGFILIPGSNIVTLDSHNKNIKIITSIMKQLKILVLSLFLVALFTQTKAQVIPLDKALNNVTDSYLGIKKALAANDGIAAENKAKELLKALDKISLNSMTPEQLNIWTKYIDQLQFDARHISEVPRVEHQKEHFSRLTKNLHAVLNVFKMKKDGI